GDSDVTFKIHIVAVANCLNHPTIFLNWAPLRTRPPAPVASQNPWLTKTPPFLLNWPPLRTSPPAPVASKSPWLTKPPPLVLTIPPLLVVGVMSSALVAEVASITPADWLINSIELLYPICPAPEIVLLTLVSVSAPLLTAPQMRLLGLSPKITLPPPVSIVPSAMRKSLAKPPPALSEIVPL